jgi:hypothetical protein
MSSTALTRVTGTVLAVSVRKGVSTKSGEPVPWKMVNVNILVANENVTVVQLPREDEYGELPGVAGGVPGAGEAVDYLTEVSIYGRDVSVRVLRDFPAEIEPLAAAA